ncbi:hypothetical protein BCY90_23680 [Agrobacterium deltaense]|uniref:hypothetical protein n=1 Tax=Agrobacterium TaxID=357 RepID=UPI0007459820|nr:MULTISPECIES: hypothetical protein [Agrobacterium]KVK48521.1 hypothetical protein L901_23850 [Agrobacterium sp. D14]MBG0510618.1 hypothetical protein [Agrobacterium leguminum]RKF36765.1 hypothetical protein BCY90_23680 [Agrobacterium deltaense]
MASQLSILITRLGYGLVDQAFMVSNEVVAGHPGSLPGFLKVGIPVQPLIADLMIKFMTPGVL